MSTKNSSVNSFGARDTLEVGDHSYEIYRLDAVPGTEKLPYSLKVLAENLLRTEDGANVTKDHIDAIAALFLTRLSTSISWRAQRPAVLLSGAAIASGYGTAEESSKAGLD